MGSQQGIALDWQPQPPVSPAATRRAASPYLLLTTSLMLSVDIESSPLYLISSMFDANLHRLQKIAYCSGLYVHDQPRRARKFGQALAVHAVIHESAAPLRKYKARLLQDFQVMRNCRLADREMLHDVADAHRLTVGRQQIQDADARGIG